MGTRFGDYFNEMAKKSGLSVRSIAAETNSHYTTIYKIMRGEVAVSEQYVDRWADALRLAPHERLRFWVLAMMSRAPDDVQDAVIGLCDQVLDLHRMRARLSDEAAKIQAALSQVATLPRVAESVAAYECAAPKTHNAQISPRKSAPKTNQVHRPSDPPGPAD